MRFGERQDPMDDVKLVNLAPRRNGHGVTRRDALKRAAMVGGALAWTAPTIQTIGIRAARASTVSPPPGQDPGPGPHPAPVEKRMTGGGKIHCGQKAEAGEFFSHSFELHSNPAILPNHLQVSFRRGGKACSFHLDALTHAYCRDDPPSGPGPPARSFDTMEGAGMGTLSWGSREPVPAKIEFRFTDSGASGIRDFARIKITADGETFFCQGRLIVGNHQAHG